MKKTDRTFGRIKKLAATLLTLVMLLSAVTPVYAAKNDDGINTTAESVQAEENYNGFPIENGYLKRDDTSSILFRYSDGFFVTDPIKYDPHLATMSQVMALASGTYVKEDDYSEGPKYIESVLQQMKFTFIESNQAYREKPTEDSVGCIFGTRKIRTDRGTLTVISTTIRSGRYGKEWVSNVTLGKSGEAKGFSDAAKQVDEELEAYMKRHEIDNRTKGGKVIFWVQGFSRGGAIANLLAKRVIDKYQAKGNKVYAYCMEAPQGGVATEENQGGDYRSIHNVINPDDVVPYVAPSNMGFKRYGVDHFLNGNEADEYNLRTSKLFPNNRCDNDPKATVTSKQLEVVRHLITTMAKDTDDLNEHMPYKLQGKHLDFIPLTPKILDQSVGDTAEFLNRIMNPTVRNGSSTPKLSRAEYENSDLQNAFRRLMAYAHGDGDLKGLFSVLDWKDWATIFVNLPVTVLGKINPYTRDGKRIYITLLETDIVYHLDLTDEERGWIADAVVNDLKVRPAVKEKLKAYGENIEQAYKDIRTIIINVLKFNNNVDDILTLINGMGGVIRNHSFLQTLAWLELYDTWYVKD